MERCYVCNHCGQCEELTFSVEFDVPHCLDCGHEIQPGETPSVCAVCGSMHIDTRPRAGAKKD